jgi:phosphopantetheine--protein transferase-like protein
MRKLPAVGIDLATIARFRRLLTGSKKHLVHKLFTPTELVYATRHKDSAAHLAGIFAVKEAASKALGASKYHYLVLEVRHREDGAPELWVDGKRTSVAVSVTHEGGIAAAVAVVL